MALEQRIPEDENDGYSSEKIRKQAGELIANMGAENKKSIPDVIQGFKNNLLDLKERNPKAYAKIIELDKISSEKLKRTIAAEDAEYGEDQANYELLNPEK